MDDTRDKAPSEVKELNKKNRVVAPWQMPPLKGISFKLARDRTDQRLISQLQNECDNAKYYHLIKLTQVNSYDRLYILKSILDFVYPCELIPCHYFQCATEVRFLARKCEEALLKIVNNNFLIPHFPPYHTAITATFEAAIVANFCEASMVEIDRSENILEVLKTRFNKETGTLDLSNFVVDEGLDEYCPLFEPRMLLFVMFLTTELENVRIINLQNNYIRHITCMDVLKDSQVVTVDLAYNQIEHIDDIKGISDATGIKNLTLEHNPLCNNYENYNYVIDVKALLPILKMLDGVDVSTPVFKKNFICSPDAQDLAQQFMAHFFAIYDSEDRDNLMEFYENDAFFSANARVIPYQKSSSLVRLSHYGLKHPFTVQSREEIMKVFATFPRTQHDTYTFVCDLLIFTPRCAVITVGGIFKELNQILGFSRTFVLKYCEGSYVIANDQIVVYNVTDYQLGWSFSFPLSVEYFGNPLPYYPEQYEVVGDLTQKLSKMNVEYSKMLLDYCDYDVTKALYLFSELYKNDVLPDTAFQHQEGCRQVTDSEKKEADLPFFSSITERSLEDPNDISTRSIWTVVNSNRFQRCEDEMPKASMDINKIERSVKTNSFERYIPERSCDEDKTDQTVPPLLQCIISPNVLCDTSSDPLAVIVPNVQVGLLPVTSFSKLTVRSDLFPTPQVPNRYIFSQRLQEKIDISSVSDPNYLYSISNHIENLSQSIPSPNDNNQKEKESQTDSLSAEFVKANSDACNDRNLRLTEPCEIINIDDDDDNVHMITTDDIVPTNGSNVHSRDSTTNRPSGPSICKSSSNPCTGSKPIEAIIKGKERAAVVCVDKTRHTDNAVTECCNTMSRREIDKLYKKVTKRCFPWLDRNHARRFQYLLDENLVNRRLCDIVTSGLKRKQMCELLDEELTQTRLQILYRKGYLSKDPSGLSEGSSNGCATSRLNKIQKERLQWLLNKNLISNNYHKYFKEMQLKEMTRECLSPQRLKALYEQRYLLRDPRLVLKDKQEPPATEEVQDEYDNGSERFFQILVRFLTLHGKDRESYISGAKYLTDYMPYRQNEVILATQYAIHKGVPRRKVLEILERELLFRNTSKLEAALLRSKQEGGYIDSTIISRKRSISGEHDKPSYKKLKLREKSSSSSNAPIEVILLEDEEQPEKFTSETCLTQKVHHTFTAEELIVVKDLDEVQKHRLRWLLDHNLLGKKYYKYMKPDDLSFITKEKLTVQRLWMLFIQEWLVRDPAFLIEKKGEQNVAVQRTNFSSSIYSKGPIISHSKYCQKLYNYLDMTPESRANDKGGIRDYLVEYTPHRSSEIICTVKYALANKHRWNEISAILRKAGLVRDIADMEIKVFGFIQPFIDVNYHEIISNRSEENSIQFTRTRDEINISCNTVDVPENESSKSESFVEIENVGAEECSFDPSLNLKPYFTTARRRRRKVTKNKMQLIPSHIVHPVYPVSSTSDDRRYLEKTIKHYYAENKTLSSEFQDATEKIIHENCRHLNEVQKDRIRWLLHNNLLGEKCYTYYAPNTWKHLAIKTISMFRLWHLYRSKKIIRDPGFLFEGDISLEKQKALLYTHGCVDAVSKYCLLGRRDQFYLKLHRYLKGDQKDKVRNYMLDYAPYRYNDIVAAVKAMSLTCAGFPLTEISDILAKDQLVLNAEKFKYDVDQMQTKASDTDAVNNCDQTNARKSDSKKCKRLLTGLDLEEISEDESSVLMENTGHEPVLAGIDLEQISDNELDTSNAVLITDEMEAVVISDEEESSILMSNTGDKTVFAGPDLEQVNDKKMKIPEATASQEMEVVVISDDEKRLQSETNGSHMTKAKDQMPSKMIKKRLGSKRKKSEQAKYAKKTDIDIDSTGINTQNRSSGMELEDISMDESTVPVPLMDEENDLIPMSKSDIDKFFYLLVDKKVDWLVDNGFLGKHYTSYFSSEKIKLLQDCESLFSLWSCFKEGLLIKDPTAVYASKLHSAFCEKSKPYLDELDGNYIYNRQKNIFIQKLDIFVCSKLPQTFNTKSKKLHVQRYLLEYTPYRRVEVLAFIKFALNEFDWTALSFALAHILLQKDLSQMETILKQYLGIPCLSVNKIRVRKMIQNVNEKDEAAMAKSETVKFFHLDHKYKKLKWLLDNRFLSENYLKYFPFDKILSLLDSETLYKLWNSFKEGLLVRDPTIMYESEEHERFQKKVERQLDRVNGHCIYKHEFNIFTQKLYIFVLSKLQPEYSTSESTHLKEYLMEYIPYRQHDVIAFVRKALKEFEWTEISTALADIIHEDDQCQIETHVFGFEKTEKSILSRNEESRTTGRKQNNMQLMQYRKRPWMCESVVNGTKKMREQLVPISSLEELKKDRLRWLLHHHLINEHFKANLNRRGIKMLTRETFTMYSLWSHFNSGLLQMNPGFLFESSFTLEQQQAMTINLVKRCLLQEINGHYVLRSSRFRSLFYIFLSSFLRRQGRNERQQILPKFAKMKNYLLEYMPSRLYEMVAELQHLARKYPLEQLTELLEHELAVHNVSELEARVCDLEQIENSQRICDLDESVRSSSKITESTSSLQNVEILKCSRISRFQNNEGDKNIEMQIVPYLPLNRENISVNPFEHQHELSVQTKVMEIESMDEEERAILRCLNELQRDRLRWLLKKKLLSKLYYKYFPLNQLRTITCKALAWDNLWNYFNFGYLMRNPDFLFETGLPLEKHSTATSQSTPSLCRSGTLFRTKFTSFLRSALNTNKEKDNCFDYSKQNYVLEYSTHRYNELVKLLRFWSVKHSWSKLSSILERKLFIRKELESMVYGYPLIDDIGDEEESLYLKDISNRTRFYNELQEDVFVSTKQNNDMQIVRYFLHPGEKRKYETCPLVTNEEPDKPSPSIIGNTNSSKTGFDTLKRQEIEVPRCLNVVQKDRLQWLVDNKLLSESYYHYLSDSQLKFISADALCLPKLWYMYYDGYLVQNPEDLFGKKISSQLKQYFFSDYILLKRRQHVVYTDADRVTEIVHTFLREYEAARKKDCSKRYKSLFCSTKNSTVIQKASATLFGQKLVSYIIMYIKAEESDAGVLGRLRNYLLDYLPFRFEDVDNILQHMVLKYSWDNLKSVFEKSLPMCISHLENRYSIGSKKNISNSMHIVPYVPRSWAIIDNVPEVPKLTAITTSAEMGENDEFQLACKVVIFLSDLEKDRLRWLLTKKLLSVSYHKYFSSDQVRFMTKLPLTLYALWFLFEYGYITRDPGFLFEADIRIEQQRELASKLYDKYTTNQFRRKFGTYLDLRMKSEQTSSNTMNNHKSYVMEYVPHRYVATINYLKQYRVFSKHPWDRVSSILKKDCIMNNISNWEFSMFGCKHFSCGKQITGDTSKGKIEDYKSIKRPFCVLSEHEFTISDAKLNEDTVSVIVQNMNEPPGVDESSEYLIKHKEKPRKGTKNMTAGRVKKRKITARTPVFPESSTLQESNEKDDVFEEFEELDILSYDANAFLQTTSIRRCVSPSNTLENVGESQVVKRNTITSSGVNMSLKDGNTKIGSDDDINDKMDKKENTDYIVNSMSIDENSGSLVVESKIDMAKKISIVEVDGSDSEGIGDTFPPNRRRSKRKRSISTITVVTDTDGSDDDTNFTIPTAKIVSSVDTVITSETTIVNFEDSSKGKVKTKYDAVCRIEDSESEGNSDNTLSTLNTVKMRSPTEVAKDFEKNKKILVLKDKDSALDETNNTVISKKSNISYGGDKLKIKPWKRIEDTDSTISNISKAIIRSVSSVEAIEELKKTEKILVAKIEKADNMIRRIISTKSLLKHELVSSVKSSREMKNRHLREIPTIEIFTRNQNNKQKMNVAMKANTKTDEVITINSDSDEDTKVDTFFQGSEMEVREGKGRLVKSYINSQTYAIELKELETVEETVDDDVEAIQKAHTIRVGNLDELSDRQSNKRSIYELEEPSEGGFSQKKVRTNECCTGLSSLEESDEVVIINGEVISFT